jgi:hypothetical protein
VDQDHGEVLGPVEASWLSPPHTQLDTLRPIHLRNMLFLKAISVPDWPQSVQSSPGHSTPRGLMLEWWAVYR